MRHEDIPEINNPKIRFPVLEGDKLMKEVLNGGYNVHPVPPPNSEIKERIMCHRDNRFLILKSSNGLLNLKFSFSKEKEMTHGRLMPLGSCWTELTCQGILLP